MSSLNERLINGRRLRLSSVTPAHRARVDAMHDADRRMVKRIAALLEHHHAGHFFRVTADHDQRLIKIELPPLLEEPHCYVIPLTVIYSDPGLKTVLNVAGQILERYRMPRSHWSTDDYRAAVAAQPFGAGRMKNYRVPT